MSERFQSDKGNGKSEMIRFQGFKQLPTLRDLPLDTGNLPEPIKGAIHWLNTTQGPFDFIESTADTTDALLENADSSVFLAIRVVHDDNSIDGLAVDAESRTLRFFSNQLPDESVMEVMVLSENRETAATLAPRLAAIQEFSLNRCFLSVYSQSNLSADSLRLWSELEAHGKAKKRLMPNGDTRFLLL